MRRNPEIKREEIRKGLTKKAKEKPLFPLSYLEIDSLGLILGTGIFLCKCFRILLNGETYLYMQT